MMIDLEKIRRNIGRDGYAIIPPVFSPQTLSDLRESCEKHLARLDRWSVPSVASIDPVCFDFASRSVFQEITSSLLSPNIDLYFDMIAAKPPGGGKRLGWHQDAAYGRTDPPGIAFWTPLESVGPNSGGLWVSPGSHTKGAAAHSFHAESESQYAGPIVDREPETAVYLNVEKGESVALHANILHKSEANRDDHRRIAYLCGYVASEGQYLDGGTPGDAKTPIFRE